MPIATRRTPATARVLVPRVPLARAVALAICILAPASVSAQIEDREPAWVVVTEPSVRMQCVNLEIYPVRTLEAGDMVRIDGAGAEWVRAIYPEDQPAFVPAGAVRTDPEAGTATLTEDHTLRALNRRSPADSWRSLFDRASPLPAGTTMPLIDEITGDDGRIAGYLVTPPRPPEAPHQPHGYLPSGSVRPADADEIARATGQQRAAPDSPADDRPADPPAEQRDEPQPARQNQAPETETEPETETGGATPQAEPDDAAPADSAQRNAAGFTAPPPAPEAVPVIDRPAPDPIDPSRVETGLLEPLVTPQVLANRVELLQADDQPDENADSTPDARTADADEPRATGSDQRTVGPLTPAQLGERFEAFRDMDRADQAEALDELIAAFERTIATVERDTVAAALGQRLDWLELQRDLREQRRALDATLDLAADRTGAIEQRLRALKDAREYRLVGRLRPSALYDGDRLPLLYRVVAGGGGASERTLAYIRPDDEGRAASLLDSIVGIAAGEGPTRVPGTPLVFDADRLVPLDIDRAQAGDNGSP